MEKLDNKVNKKKSSKRNSLNMEMLNVLSIDKEKVKKLIDTWVILLTSLKWKCYIADMYVKRFENLQKLIETDKFPDFNQLSIKRYYEYDMMRGIKKYVEENQEYTLQREAFLGQISRILWYIPQYKDVPYNHKKGRRKNGSTSKKGNDLYNSSYKFKPINRRASLWTVW